MTSYKGGKARPALSVVQLHQFAQGAGFTDDQAAMMVQIALKESSGVPNVIGGPNSNGTKDYGLWQINTVHKPASNWDDAQANAVMAKKVFDAQGYRAWSVCKDDKCSNLTASQPKVGDPGGKRPEPNLGALLDVPSAIGKAVAALNVALLKFAGNAVMVTLAVVFLVLGVILIRGQSVVKTALQAKKALPV